MPEVQLFPRFSGKSGGQARRGSRRRGSELVEGMIILVPFMALVFLVIDISWALFIEATLQFAVQQGVNYAATGQAPASGGQLAGIQSVVINQSLQLASAPGVTFNINFYSTCYAAGPTCNTPPALTSGAGANAYGNIVQATVTYPFTPLAPLMRSGAQVPLTATASAMVLSTATPAL